MSDLGDFRRRILRVLQSEPVRYHLLMDLGGPFDYREVPGVAVETFELARLEHPGAADDVEGDICLRELLLDLRNRGLAVAPELAVRRCRPGRRHRAAPERGRDCGRRRPSREECRQRASSGFVDAWFVPVLPVGTIVQAPEQAGGVVKRWHVDGPHTTEADLLRVASARVPRLSNTAAARVIIISG